MSICRFGIIGAGSIAAHFCKAVKLVEGDILLESGFHIKSILHGKCSGGYKKRP